MIITRSQRILQLAQQASDTKKSNNNDLQRTRNNNSSKISRVVSNTKDKINAEDKWEDIEPCPKRETKSSITEKNHQLMLPPYESTRGTTADEQNLGLNRFSLLENSINIDRIEKPSHLFKSTAVSASTTSPQDVAGSFYGDHNASHFFKNDGIANKKPFAYVTPTKQTTVFPVADNTNLYMNFSDITTNERISTNVRNIESAHSSPESVIYGSDSGSEYVPSPSIISATSSDSSTISLSVDQNNVPLVNPNIKVKAGQEVNLLEFGNAQSHCRKLKTNSQNKIFKELTNRYHNELQSKLASDSDYDGTVSISAAKYNEENGRRIRDKVHACYFCENFILSPARHFESKHGNEMEIAQILAMTKHSQQRREALAEIIKAGDFYHNCNVLTIKQGELILVRRPTETSKGNIKYSDYGPCPECMGFMIKKQLWQHLRICKKNRSMFKSVDKIRRNPVAESTALLNGIFEANLSSDFLNAIVAKLSSDEITAVCKEDNLILRFGSLQYEKYGATQCELIRQGMRQLARLLIEIKKIDNDIRTLSDCTAVENFDTVVQATKNLCSAHINSVKRPEFGIPSLALKIGYALRKCVSISTGMALRKRDYQKTQSLESFLKLLDAEWSVRISSNALATLYKRKMNASLLLPLTSDLVKLAKHLDSEINNITKDITNLYSAKVWTHLATLTLSRIMLFNKRRSGETAKMTVEQYAARPTWSNETSGELVSSLSAFEKKLASKLALVETEGKRGQKVAVLLTETMKNCIDLLINTRRSAKVREENPYIFARVNSTTAHLRGHECLRKVCEEAGLESPEYITGTKLRKYVATVSQIFSLTENESDWLARHLGHNIRVHREFYRLQENAVELTKVSRLLLAVDQGEAHKYAGKELNAIGITGLPDIDEDEQEQSDEEGDNEEDRNKLCNTSSKSKIKAGMQQGKSLRNIKTPFKKKKWSTEESAAVLQHFKILVKHDTLPGKQACEECMEKYPVLSSRKWSDVKFFIKNHLIRLKRNIKTST